LECETRRGGSTDNHLFLSAQRIVRPGARSDDWPAQERIIRPYAAEAFSNVFKVDSCQVHVLDARRTFWEKVTLLHAEYHRPPDKPSGEGLSRHYYDLYQLASQDIGKEALGDLELLARVVAHKRLFFSSGWAQYETAVPGGIHLVPTEARANTLRADYRLMREMIFGNGPSWEDIIAKLRELEHRINAASCGDCNQQLDRDVQQI